MQSHHLAFIAMIDAVVRNSIVEQKFSHLLDIIPSVGRALVWYGNLWIGVSEKRRRATAGDHHGVMFMKLDDGFFGTGFQCSNFRERMVDDGAIKIDGDGVFHCRSAEIPRRSASSGFTDSK